MQLLCVYRARVGEAVVFPSSAAEMTTDYERARLDGHDEREG
jgi:hypothetical protein